MKKRLASNCMSMSMSFHSLGSAQARALRPPAPQMWALNRWTAAPTHHTATTQPSPLVHTPARPTPLLSPHTLPQVHTQVVTTTSTTQVPPNPVYTQPLTIHPNHLHHRHPSQTIIKPPLEGMEPLYLRLVRFQLLQPQSRLGKKVEAADYLTLMLIQPI